MILRGETNQDYLLTQARDSSLHRIKYILLVMSLNNIWFITKIDTEHLFLSKVWADCSRKTEYTLCKEFLLFLIHKFLLNFNIYPGRYSSHAFSQNVTTTQIKKYNTSYL